METVKEYAADYYECIEKTRYLQQYNKNAIFIILSFHIGLHIRVISAKLKVKMNKAVKNTFTVLFLLIAAYGVYAFISRGFADYMFMKVMFAFFDPKESKILFFLNYAAVMVLVAEIAYWLDAKRIAFCRKRNAD